MTSALGGTFVMPKRLESDPEQGMLRVYRLGDDHIVIEPGDGQTITLSEYQAARVTAMLALFLNLRFIKKHAAKLTL